MEMQIPYHPLASDVIPAAIHWLQRALAGTGARLVIADGHALVEVQADHGLDAGPTAKLLPTDVEHLVVALRFVRRDAQRTDLRAAIPTDVLASLEDAQRHVEKRFRPLLAPVTSILNNNPEDTTQ